MRSLIAPRSQEEDEQMTRCPLDLTFVFFITRQGAHNGTFKIPFGKNLTKRSGPECTRIRTQWFFTEKKNNDDSHFSKVPVLNMNKFERLRLEK